MLSSINLCVWCEIGVKFHFFFLFCYSVAQAPLKKCLNYCGNFVKNHITIYLWVYFWTLCSFWLIDLSVSMPVSNCLNYCDRGWDGWMASLTRWTWVWVNSGSWWWTGRPGVLQFMGSQRVRHDWVTELDWTELNTKPWKLVV